MLDKIKLVLNPILEEMGITLIEFVSKTDKWGIKLLITVDTENNISLEECALLSSNLAKKLDETDLIRTAYTIEVSSPGLSSNITHDLQFRKAVGKVLNVTYSDTDGIDRTEDIYLESINNGLLNFKRKKEILVIDKDQIKSAKLRLQW